MSGTLSKADYLKRYMSDSADVEKTKKRRKKPKSVKAHSGLKIIDEDLDLKTILPAGDANQAGEDEDNEDEEAPTVAEIVDERPVHIQRMEQYRKDSKWKLLASDKQAVDSASADDEEVETSNRRQRHDSDSDMSPERPKVRHSDSDESPPRNKKTVKRLKNGNFQNTIESRKQRHDSDSDHSPPRRQRHDSDSDQSLPRRQRHDSDSDQSLPRRQRHDSDQSPPRKQRHNSDSDQPPPRKQRHNSDSDQSPPRKSKKQNSDSDASPPRRHRKRSDSDQLPPRRGGNDLSKSNEGKMIKTLAGAKAGLSSAREMRNEAEKLKKRENKMFGQIDADTLGKNAETVFRDKGGKRRNLKEEKLRQKEEDSKKEQMNEKYMVWGKGMVQKAQQEETLQEVLHEMDKPLARFKDDEDLDAMLKERERAEDPMLAYMQKKKAKENRGGVKVKAKPRYSGPEPPPNRFNIWPGYRWDGVDRSNGFEKEFYAKMANKKAVADMAYKWSVEDM